MPNEYVYCGLFVVSDVLRAANFLHRALWKCAKLFGVHKDELIKIGMIVFDDQALHYAQIISTGITFLIISTSFGL